jgi:hypothetical protein
MSITAIGTVLVLLAGAGAVYWFMLRPMLRQWAEFKPFYDTLDEVGARWTFKVRMALKGLKTVLWAMFLMIAPGVLTILELLGSIDISALLDVVIPEKYAWAKTAVATVLISAIGYITLQLRLATTTPVEQPVPIEAPIEVPTVEGKPDVEIMVAPKEDAAPAQPTVEVVGVKAVA